MPLQPAPLSAIARVLGDNLREQVAAGRLDGFAGLVLDAYSPSLILSDLSETGRREVVHLLSGSGLQLSAVQTSITSEGFAPRTDLQQSIDRVCRAIRATADLRCRLLLVDVGRLPPAVEDVAPAPTVTPELAGLILIPEKKSIDAPPAAPREKPQPEFESTVDTALAEIAQWADRTGVFVAIGSQLSSQASLVRAIRASRCALLGLDLDPLALLADEWPMEELLSRAARSVLHVRVRDGVRGLGNRVQSTLVGEGKVPWPLLLQNLRESDFSGPLTLDPTDLPSPRIAAGLGRSFMVKQLG
jgi:sugar phosphate isomerase/epimerase